MRNTHAIMTNGPTLSTACRTPRRSRLESAEKMSAHRSILDGAWVERPVTGTMAEQLTGWLSLSLSADLSGLPSFLSPMVGRQSHGAAAVEAVDPGGAELDPQSAAAAAHDNRLVAVGRGYAHSRHSLKHSFDGSTPVLSIVRRGCSVHRSRVVRRGRGRVEAHKCRRYARCTRSVVRVSGQTIGRAIWRSAQRNTVRSERNEQNYETYRRCSATRTNRDNVERWWRLANDDKRRKRNIYLRPTIYHANERIDIRSRSTRTKFKGDSDA